MIAGGPEHGITRALDRSDVIDRYSWNGIAVLTTHDTEGMALEVFGSVPLPPGPIAPGGAGAPVAFIDTLMLATPSPLYQGIAPRICAELGGPSWHSPAWARVSVALSCSELRARVNSDHRSKSPTTAEPMIHRSRTITIAETTKAEPNTMVTLGFQFPGIVLLLFLLQFNLRYRSSPALPSSTDTGSS